MSLGPLEIILLLVVVALIFGARKLPELGKGLGQGIKEFKKETRDPAGPMTDVTARPLDPVVVAPEVARTADGRGVEVAPERDHRA